MLTGCNFFCIDFRNVFNEIKCKIYHGKKNTLLYFYELLDIRADALVLELDFAFFYHLHSII